MGKSLYGKGGIPIWPLESHRRKRTYVIEVGTKKRETIRHLKAWLTDPSGLTGLVVWNSGEKDPGKGMEYWGTVNFTRVVVGNSSGLMVSPDCKYIGKAVAQVTKKCR